MPSAEIDILGIDRGSVVAPAGCGKTHLITAALSRHDIRKPILILTHTNAGVAALRDRLRRYNVPSSNYRLLTIDGWAIRLASTFPIRAGINLRVLELNNPGRDYPAIREAATKLVQEGHIADVLCANYSRLIVDEYQDCSIRQHILVAWAAQFLPTCVLGDPLQAIFGFGSDRLPDWQNDVLTQFPLAGELATPWRWINANAAPLGQWLLDCRRLILSGQPIDLQSSPEQVQWVQVSGQNDHAVLTAAARTSLPGGENKALIIGDSMRVESRHRIASSVPGAVTIEAVDMRDFVAFARNLDIQSPQALTQIIEFAKSLMTNVGAAELLRRVDSLARGTARREPNAVENAALAFLQQPSYQAAASIFTEASRVSGARVYRPAVFRACLKAFQAVNTSTDLTLYDAAIQVREQNRILGRSLPGRGVGSTLLLKGLESDLAIVLNAGGLDGRNLYVAMTRGSRALIVCAPEPLLQPVL